MKTNVELYLFVNDDTPILASVQNDYDCTIIKDYKSLKNIINKISYLNSHILLIDFEYIISLNGVMNKHIKKDLMRSWLSVIAYSDSIISLKDRGRLYRLGFKAILDNSNKNRHHTLMQHVFNYTNIYMEKLQTNFIIAFTHCREADNVLRDLQYLIAYVADYYKLSIQDISDIYLAVSSLIIGIQENRFIKVSEMIYTIFKSLEVNRLYKNYLHPKTFNEEVVTTLLYLLYLKNLDEKKVPLNIESINKTVFDTLTECYELKKIIISSYREIDMFWEQIYDILLYEYKSDTIDVVEAFLEMIYHALVNCLDRTGYLFVYIDKNYTKGIGIFINLFGANTTLVQECFDMIHIDNASISKSIESKKDGSSELILILDTSEKSTAPKKPSLRKSGILKETDINKMHYKKEEKISATAFLQEFEIDRYMLDDLNENESDMKDLLFSADELNDVTIEKIVTILNKYITILHETIEFNDLAISLDSLSKVFQRISLDMLEKEKREQLRFFIQGLIEDLQSWKQYIFIEPNTPDIHYLDASLLENCASIEHFILSDEKDDTNREEDEDDLEFF